MNEYAMCTCGHDEGEHYCKPSYACGECALCQGFTPAPKEQPAKCTYCGRDIPAHQKSKTCCMFCVTDPPKEIAVLVLPGGTPWCLSINSPGHVYPDGARVYRYILAAQPPAPIVSSPLTDEEKRILAEYPEAEEWAKDIVAAMKPKPKRKRAKRSKTR